MNLFKKILMGNYEINITCSNCGAPNKTRVPRGTPVNDFVKSGMCKCEVCGCTFEPKEYKTKWLK